jgi:nickel transport protein
MLRTFAAIALLTPGRARGEPHARGREVTRGLAVLVAALLPAVAVAHEVLHEVAPGRATAVRAYESDGEPLADEAYEVYSPADPEVAWQKGRTDREGWLAFVPAVAGTWRVRVIEATGHGLDLALQAGPGAPATAAPSGGAPSTLGFVLRPLLGLAALALVFGGLLVLHRRRRGGVS